MAKHIATTTQGAHPWRATIRTILALAGAIASATPLIYVAITQSSPGAATGAAAQVLAIAAAITRVLALPVVETFLQRFIPWLAAGARGDDAPAIAIDPDAVVIPRARLEGWDNTPPLTGSDWREFAETLPPSEAATALLSVADAMDSGAQTSDPDGYPIADEHPPTVSPERHEQ